MKPGISEKEAIETPDAKKARNTRKLDQRSVNNTAEMERPCATMRGVTLSEDKIEPSPHTDATSPLP